MKTIPRMRTIKQCLEEIKKVDSETAISEWYIRWLCKNNKIEYLACGSKSLVNFDDLIYFLNFGNEVVGNDEE